MLVEARLPFQNFVLGSYVFNLQSCPTSGNAWNRIVSDIKLRTVSTVSVISLFVEIGRPLGANLACTIAGRRWAVKLGHRRRERKVRTLWSDGKLVHALGHFGLGDGDSRRVRPARAVPPARSRRLRNGRCAVACRSWRGPRHCALVIGQHHGAFPGGIAGQGFEAGRRGPCRPFQRQANLGRDKLSRQHAAAREGFAGRRGCRGCQRDWRTANRQLESGIAEQGPHFQVFEPLLGQRRFSLAAVRLIEEPKGQGVDLAAGDAGLGCEPVIGQTLRRFRPVQTFQDAVEGELAHRRIAFAVDADDGHGTERIVHGREAVTFAVAAVPLAAETAATEQDAAPVHGLLFGPDVSFQKSPAIRIQPGGVGVAQINGEDLAGLQVVEGDARQAVIGHAEGRDEE